MWILSFSFFDPHSARQNDQFHTLQKTMSPLIYEPLYLKHKLLWQFCLLLGWEKAFSYLTHCRTIQFSCNIHLIFISISWNAGAMRTRSEIIHVEWSWDSCHLVQFHSVQLLSRVWLFVTPWTAVLQASLSITNSCTPGLPVHHQLPELTQTHVYWVGDAIQPSHPLSSPFPPAFNLSQHQGLFHWVSSLHQVDKILEFQLQHQSIQWVFRTDSFRIAWFDLFAVQGTLKSLLQHHSSKASTLWSSALFIVQLSHPYMTPRKTIALTRWIFVSNVCFLICCLGWS